MGVKETGGIIVSEKLLGKIVEIDGDYFLETSGVKAATRKERARREKDLIKIGSAGEKARYAKLVGQKAEVILSEPIRSVIGIAVEPKLPDDRFPCYFILCYIPVPWFWRLPIMNKELIAPLAKQFLEEGILSQENFNKVINAPSVQ